MYEPNGLESETCLLMAEIDDLTDDGTWMDVRCTDTYSVLLVCEKHAHVTEGMFYFSVCQELPITLLYYRVNPRILVHVCDSVHGMVSYDDKQNKIMLSIIRLESSRDCPSNLYVSIYRNLGY